MTFGKATLLTIGFAGALAVGIGLSIANHRESTTPDSATVANAPAARLATERSAKPVAASPADAESAVAMRPVSPQSPELEHRLKPLLNRGTNMDSAAEGFKDWRDFATIAHASHNTQVPFVVLKHHVLNEGRTLESVISEFKPDLDAKAEASRAREQTSQDLASPR
ncbi:MAG: hypothetical protein ACM4AI_25860 [Acidobacteriota bacterium]